MMMRHSSLRMAVIFVIIAASNAQTPTKNTTAQKEPAKLLEPLKTDFSREQVMLDEIKKKIAGREDEPAEQVFKNIEILKGNKASRLPGMMGGLVP